MKFRLRHGSETLNDLWLRKAVGDTYLIRFRFIFELYFRSLTHATQSAIEHTIQKLKITKKNQIFRQKKNTYDNSFHHCTTSVHPLNPRAEKYTKRKHCTTFVRRSGKRRRKKEKSKNIHCIELISTVLHNVRHHHGTFN